ncbi:hypothetical protein E2C01_018008 [Portunus trituberculatus]|uniref:Uncharacterized protein n=1 Tax=Portunus trituberculatus TaxID=210409 RepID=A0A5B7DVM0_PORTR|nr:hypothetical protein [Portunus trituberculatus]
MAAQSCVGCKRWLLGKVLEPHFRCVSCRHAMCLAEDWYSECSHLPLLQFQAYVKDTEKHSAKEKKRVKSSGSSSEKHSRRQEPTSEATWASSSVAVEADLAAMKASIGQLSAVLLPLAFGSAFSRFADSRVSVQPPPRLVTGVGGPWSPPGLGPSVVAAGSGGASLSVSPLLGLALGVRGGQATSVPSPAPELAVRGVSLHAAPCSAPPPVASLLPLFLALPRSFRGSMELAYVCAAPLPSLALGGGVQFPAVSGSSADYSGFGGVSLSAVPLPSLTPAVSVVQTPAVSGASREFLGLGGMSLCAAPLPDVAPGLSGLQAPAVPVSSVASPGVSGLSLHAAPLSGQVSGVCGEPAPAGPVSSLGLVGGGKMGLHGGLPDDGNFAGSASVSSMGLPHVNWLHGSMPSQVPPYPVDAGVDPGGTLVSLAGDTGWPSFSEEMDEVFDDVPSGEAGTPDEEGASSFCELITSTGVERTSETSRPGPTPLVLPHSPLALEVHREQLGCSLGISNPASAKFALPRRWASRAESWYTPEGDSCGAPPLNDELLHLVESKDLSPEETVFGYGSQHHQSPSLPVTRSGQLFSGSGPTVSASQGSTSVTLEVFAGTSCIPSTSFQQALSGSVVSVMSDNSTVVVYLRKSGGTRSEPLSALARMVLRWCESCSLSLCPVFVPGCRNVIVDVLNQECVGSEWTLHPKIYRKVFQVWGSPLVDLFATALTRRLPLYVSPLLDQGAW